MTISDRVRVTSPPALARAATADAPEPLDRVTLSGPVPDFAPVAGIVAHNLARELCPAFVNTASDQLRDRFQLANGGYEGPNSGYDTSMVWTRDYFPTYVRKSDGELKVLKYLSINPKRSQYSGSDYIPVAPPKPGQEFFRTPGAQAGRWLDVETLPLEHEDGNLVSTGEYAFMTDHVFAENAPVHRERHLLEAGYQPRQPEQVLDLLSKGLEIPRDKIVIMPRLPGEATGHVDMYVMALGPRRVLLPKIEDEALGVITYPQEIGVGKQVQGFLNEQAERLEKQGFQVERLPMMAPTFLTPDAQDVAGWKGHYDSPTNSMLANLGTGQKDALVPTFSAQGFPEGYQQLNRSYQERWKSFFSAEGFQTSLVDATRLGQANGLFRCLTHPIPA